MSTLYDRLCWEGYVQAGKRRQFNPDDMHAKDPVQVFAIQNVADYMTEYMNENHDQSPLDTRLPVAPPFPTFWMEHHLPAGRLKTMPFASDWGTMFLAEEIDKDPEPQYPDLITFFNEQRTEVSTAKALLRTVGQAVGSIEESTGKELRSAERFVAACTVARELASVLPIRWVVFGATFLRFAGKPIRKAVHTYYFLDEDGVLVQDETGPAMQARLVDGQGLENEERSQISFGMAYLGVGVPLFAATFLHCKNVTIQTEQPPQALSKAHRKKHGRPLVRYHVLSIAPMKRILAEQGNIEKTGLHKALHICRGHFKDYRERGLFGRNKGLYWWDSHVRGSIDEGIVDKDYAVRAPREKVPS